jgi:hypothetical protein
MRRPVIVSALASAIVLAGLLVAPSAQAATYTKVVRYGPHRRRGP